MSAQQGLRLRKRDDVTFEQDDPLLMHSDKGRQARQSYFSSSLLVALVALGSLTICALPLLNTLKPSLLKGIITSFDTPDKLRLLDEGLVLHIPGLNKHRGRLSDKSVLESWSLQVCPGNEAVACPNQLDLPLHVQLHIITSTRDSILQAPLWQSVPDATACDFGSVWKMSPPTELILQATKIEIQIRWHKKSCFRGQMVHPWERTIPLSVELPRHFAAESRRNTTNSGLFVRDAAWQANTQSQAPDDPTYTWAPTHTRKTSNLLERLTTHDAFVLPEAIVTERYGYGKFDDLGNYELLCFFGNQTMGEIRVSFLDIRPQISKQRPFKFHFYSMADLQQPDRYWDLDKKQRIRKCKHILINFEEFKEPVTQKAYEDQIVNLIGHVLRLMDDDTFPIRVFTWTESPMGSRHCHSPYLPWSNDHPCNDVLRKLFDPTNPVFPSRVKLLDNADLTLPYVDRGVTSVTNSMRPFILAAIALRVFVLTGDQVATWRAMGQRGAVDGLHRNGIVEPNFDLVPYKDWGKPL